MEKQMPTLGVLGVYTGIVLKQGGFGEIHEVMDHLYPGIMTLSAARMAKTASKEVGRQHPELADLGECGSHNYEQYSASALKRFGESIPIEGPHGTGNPDMFDGEAA
jgi:hypothetical protein